MGIERGKFLETLMLSWFMEIVKPPNLGIGKDIVLINFNKIVILFDFSDLPQVECTPLGFIARNKAFVCGEGMDWFLSCSHL